MRLRPTLRHVAAWLLAAAVLAAGFCLPTASFLLWDHNSFGQVTTEELQPRAAEWEPPDICQMLHMAYSSDKRAVLTRGKYLTPDEAFAQAKMILEPLESLEFLNLDWDACTLQNYSIVFCISSEDLSRRMTLWTLTVISERGAVIQVSMEERTRTVLSFSYRNPERPFHTSQIPPTESQKHGQALIDFFIAYWGLSISSTTVISDSGGHLLTAANPKSGQTAEIPYTLDQDGICINVAN